MIVWTVWRICILGLKGLSKDHSNKFCSQKGYSLRDLRENCFEEKVYSTLSIRAEGEEN